MKAIVFLIVGFFFLILLMRRKKEVVNLFSSFTRSISNLGYHPFSIVEKVSRTSLLIFGNNFSIVVNGNYNSSYRIYRTKKFILDGLGNPLRSVV